VKQAIIFVVSLLSLAALAEWIILLQVRIPPVPLAAFLVCFSLVLGVFVGLTSAPFVRQLREWSVRSAAAAAGLPFLLLAPYLVFAIGTGTFSVTGLAKLSAYIAAPVLLLLPDRLHRPARAGWRDFAAMAVLAVPVGANWLTGIWTWPQDLYFFRPLYSVCVGVYAFLVIRNLDGVGYRLTLRKRDVLDGLANLLGFALLGIPLGIGLHFIHPHSRSVAFSIFVFQCLGIYLTIAIPEELLFRGILQNFLVRSLPERGGFYGVAVASVVFGLAHLHHAPVPNWRYAIMATLAGLFYGNAFRTRHRISASALTHTLVDTLWHFWF
jgi:membrane protease YdiL (CAAX protease family)